MQYPTFKQELKGSFAANVIPRGQCGFMRGQQEFNYVARIHVDKLDNSGFVYDNLALNKVFNSWEVGNWHASCEDLAGGAVNKIIEILGKRALFIEVEICPNKFATLTCSWERGCDLPDCLPTPVKEGE